MLAGPDQSSTPRRHYIRIFRSNCCVTSRGGIRRDLSISIMPADLHWMGDTSSRQLLLLIAWSRLVERHILCIGSVMDLCPIVESSLVLHRGHGLLSSFTSEANLVGKRMHRSPGTAVLNSGISAQTITPFLSSHLV
jgi:hypothetical protein